MESKRLQRSPRAFSGFIATLAVYVALLLAAYALYPKGFSPIDNTLAQLGDPILNPLGAIFYDAGVILVCGSTLFIAAALLVAPKQWLTSRSKTKRRRIFYVTVSFMLLFAAFYLLSTLLPSSINYDFNQLLTLLFLATLELFIVFSAVGIRRLRDHLPWVPPFGFAVAAANLLLVVASAVFGFPIFGWAIAVLSWSYTAAYIYEFSAPQPTV